MASKLLVLLFGLLCAAALAANLDSTILSPSLLKGYKEGYHYVYDFEGQLASSLSNGEDFAAVRMRCQLEMDFLNGNSVLVKLIRPELAQLNAYLPEPARLHSWQKFENVNIKSEHSSKLELPFEMRYENGKISEIKFHNEDNVWSENIKRSIINLLQVKLERPSEEDNKPYYSSNYYYNTNETTIEGDCEMAYYIQKNDDDTDLLKENKPSVNITKTVNFEKCRLRPELRYNYYRQSEPIEWNTHNKDNKRKTSELEQIVDSVSQYEISLENNRIQTSQVLSHYSYDMVDKDHVSLVSHAVSQLKLKTEEKRTAPESDFDTKPHQTLMHSNEFDLLRERFITEGDEKYLKQNPYLRMDYPSEVIKNIVRRLVKSSIEKNDPEGMEEDAVRQFGHLVSTLRLCSKEDITEIHTNIFNGNEYDEKTQLFVKEILADALAVAGTKNTIDHLVEKIKSEEISPSKGARTLEKLHKIRMTSYEMVKPVWKLCESEIAEKNPNLKRSCYLACGAMVNAMCGHEHEHEQDHEKWVIASNKEKKLCSSETKQLLIKSAMQLFEKSNSKDDKILALKTLGNMGIDQSIIPLEKIIRDQTQDRLVRYHAIDAVRNLRDQIPKKLQRLLIPIFRDRREHPELRMNAFYQMMKTRPDSALLHLIVAEMAHETNNDVKTQVVTIIRGMAENADWSLDEETKQAIKSCMVLLDQMDEAVVRQSASNMHQYGYFSEPSSWHELGALFHFGSMFSNDSYLPKELMASLDLLMDGRITPNSWQYGVHMQEIEQLFTRIFQNVESKSFDDIVVRGRRSALTDYNPMEMLKSLYNKMQIVARRTSPASAEPMMLIYRRQNNMDYSFYLLDDSHVPEIVKKFITDGKLDVSMLEQTDLQIRTNGAWYNFESLAKIPTTIGIPMLISTKMATIGFVDGKFSLNFDPANGEKIRGVKIDFNIQPQMASSVFMKMEAFSPLFTSGIKTIHSTQARVPIQLCAEVVSPNLKPKITWTMPEKETRLVHLQSRPITFVRVWPSKSSVFIEAKEKTLIVPEYDRLLTNQESQMVEPFSGIQAKLEGHWHRRPLSGYNWALSGENAFAFKISPTQTSAKSIRLSGEYVTDRNSGVSAKLKFDKIFDQQPQLFDDNNPKEVIALKEQVERSKTLLTSFSNVNLKIETVDSSDRNTVNIDSMVACDERMHTCMFSKILKVDIDNEWTWETNGQFVRPELHGIYAGVRSSHIVGKVMTSWGSAQRNTASINIYGKPSDERIDSFKMLLNRKTETSDDWEKESLRDKKFEDLPSILKPNDYSVAVEHQVTDETVEKILPLYTWFKACPMASIYMPNKADVDSMISRKHSTIFGRYIMDNNHNFTLTTPEEQIELTHWESSPQEQKLSRQPKTIVDLFAKSHEDYSQCTYKREQIKTFDGQDVKIPMTTCYTILAKDCGNADKPKFALMAKKMVKGSDDLKVKFMTQKKTFELYKSDGAMVIKADGMLIREKEYDEYRIRKIETSEETIYEVKCPHAEAILRFDGKKITVKISDMFMNRQCGVCGHMNNDRDDDLLKNDKTQAESISEFQLSYMFRDGEDCTPEAIQEIENVKPKSRRRQDGGDNWEKKDKSSSEEERRPERSPVKKTLTLEKKTQVCFSIKPEYSCPEGFEKKDGDTNMDKKQIDFVCKPREDPETQRWLRRARKGETIEDLESENVSQTDEIEIPSRCVKY